MTTEYLGRRKPRQLDIIDDPELRKKSENRPYLSTGPQAQNGADLSTGQGLENRGDLSTTRPLENRPDLSTVTAPENGPDLSTGFRRFDARRKSLGVSIARLCATAGVHPNTYETAQKGSTITRPTTMSKLRRALDRLSSGEKADAPRSLCESYIRYLTARVAEKVGADPQAVLATKFDAENTNDPVWLQASRLRRAAIYLVVEGVGISKASVGHAIGVSRQAVFKSVAMIEMERDRSVEFDHMMRAMMINVAVEK